MKSLVLRLLIIVISCFSLETMNAQTKQTSLADITDDAVRSKWIYFKPESKVHALSIFESFKKEFGLSANDKMELLRSYANPITGIIQHRFQQYFNNIPLHGAVMCIYEKDGFAYKANGKLIKGIQSSGTAISEQDALQKALEYLPAKDYAWLDAKREARYKEKKKNQSATLYPKSELIYMYKKGMKTSLANDYVLCHKFNLVMQRSVSYAVFVNAQTGEIVNELPLSIRCNAATAQTPFNGSRTIYTSVQGRCSPANGYELWNDCHAGNYIKVENDDFGAGTDDPFCRGSNNDWSVITGITADAVQVHWGMNESFNWYNSYFNWYSYDDAGGSVDCTVAYEFEDSQGNPTGNNAQYNELEEDFDFGYGNNGITTTDSYTCLDIVGHEFTHGVDDYTADLDYSDESGALDESFADIMGELIEMDTDLGLDTTLWRHGEDKGGFRSFSNPNNSNQPDTYLGSYWHDYNTNSNDHGGVHTNSGVQNFVFYLLATGKTGTNDNGDHYDVNAISLSSIRNIAFTAHTYLWGTAEFIDARDAWIEAAIDLYGSCSDEAIQVGNAWHAVGVGSQSPFYTKVVTGILTAVTANKTYEAINHVYSGGLTTINSVSGVKEVRMYSANEITLNVGFIAESGTAFRAKVNSCSVTLHTAPKLVSETYLETETESIKLNDEWFTVYPNPSKEKVELLFSVPAENISTIRLINSLGKIIEVIKDESMQHSSDNSYIIRLDKLPSGIYFVEAIINNQNRVKKVIKL